MQRFCRQILKLSLPLQRKTLPPILHQFNLLSHPKFHFSQFNNSDNPNSQEIKFGSQDSFYKPIPIDQTVLTAITAQAPKDLTDNFQKHLDLYQSGKDVKSFSEEEALEIFRATSQMGLCCARLQKLEDSKEWYHHAFLFGNLVKLERFNNTDHLIYSLMGTEAEKLGELDLALQCVEKMINLAGGNLTEENAFFVLEGLNLKAKIQVAKKEPKEEIDKTLRESLALSMEIVETFETYDQKLALVYNRHLHFLEKVGMYEEVEKYALKAIGLAKKTLGEGNAEASCHSYYQTLLRLYMVQRRHAEGLPYAEKLKKFFDESQQFKDTDRLAAGIVLAKVHFLLEDFKSAIKVFEEFDNYPKEKLPEGWGVGVYLEMAKAYLGLGDVKKAHEYFLKEVEFITAKTGEVSRDLCVAWENGAHLFAQIPELRSECKAYFEKAIEISEKRKAPQDERFHFKIGYASWLYEWGDFANSLKYSKEAESISQGLETSQDTELLYSTLARGYGQMKEYADAFRNFEKAMKECEANGMTSGKLVNYYLAMIDGYNYFKDEEMVEKWIPKTLDAVKRVCDDRMLLQIYRPMLGSLVQWFVEKGKTEEAQKVLKYMKKAS